MTPPRGNSEVGLACGARTRRTSVILRRLVLCEGRMCSRAATQVQRFRVRASSGVAVASLFASRSRVTTSSAAPCMMARCSGNSPPCAAHDDAKLVDGARGPRCTQCDRAKGCGSVRSVGTVAHLSRYRGSLEVGVEQQHHHLRRPALCSGVVQRQLPALQTVRRQQVLKVG